MTEPTAIRRDASGRVIAVDDNHGRRQLLESALAGPDMTPQWDLGTAEPVPMARWGKDHWTTFAYVETRWVDHRGMLDHDRMRCDRTRHPLFYAAKRRTVAFGSDADGSQYATRLKTEAREADGRWGVVELLRHDDYDCVDDARREGLIEVTMPREAYPGGVFLDAYDRGVRVGMAPGLEQRGDLLFPPVTGLVELGLMTAASLSLTDRGQRIAGELRSHLAGGRSSHQFMPSPALLQGIRADEPRGERTATEPGGPAAEPREAVEL